ncbi:MAG: transporter, family, 3-phenylpropionic acid transporter [Hyphomicrobiales bacterium]|jgi:PPP family 3-phenylpropionic acid transporter|nr:transporter, family, 3-phenylpropionic acid transporter [Hyphomicrobiales bacterium]
MAHLKPAIVNDSFAWRLALVYAAFFAIIGWHLPLFPVWLTAGGLDPAAIGFVLAAMQAVRVIATPAGTRIADRYGSLHGAIVITAMATAVAIVLLATATGFTFILIAAVTVAFVSAPVLPLTDAYGLKGLAQRQKSYGPVRLWGSVAFIAANLTGGVLLDVLAPGNLIWVICAGNCALAVAALLLVRTPGGEAPAPTAPQGHSHLRQPAFLAIAAAGSLIQASHAVYYGFSTLDWTAKGFNGVTVGTLWALGVAAEIVLFAYAGRLPRRIGPVTLIAIGAAGAIVRWSAMMFDPPAALLFPLQLLHALSFGATHLGTMMFLSQNAPEGNRAAAQGDVSTMSSLAMAAASALAGVLYGTGGSLAYAAMAMLAVGGTAFALLAARLMRTGALAPKG